MAYYRLGMRLKASRAVARAMARSGNKHNAMTLENMIQASKNRFGGAVRDRRALPPTHLCYRDHDGSLT